MLFKNCSCERLNITSRRRKKGGMLQRKGAYFYVIDAFIASIIIIAAIIVLFSQFYTTSNTAQAYYTAEDFLSTLESTPIRSVDHGTVRAWLNNGTITAPQISVLQQIALFNASGRRVEATTLTQIMADQTVQNIGLEVLLDGNRLYIRQPTSQNSAESLLSARRLLLLPKNATTLYPPAIIEVRTWQ
jgi:hypothetical protein